MAIARLLLGSSPIMLKCSPIMPGGSTYYSLTSTHYSFTAANYSNLIKEDRSVRVISNELNDTLSVFEAKYKHTSAKS